MYSQWIILLSVFDVPIFLISGIDRAYIGLNNTANDFLIDVTTGNEMSAYRPWATSQPEMQGCVYMDVDELNWGADDCSSQYPVICTNVNQIGEF